MPSKAADNTSDVKTQKLGFTDKGKAYPGVHPDTGERVTISLEALKDEFGPKTGEKMYQQIRDALASNPTMNMQGEKYHPDLQLSGIEDDVRAKVDAILTEKE